MIENTTRTLVWQALSYTVLSIQVRFSNNLFETASNLLSFSLAMANQSMEMRRRNDNLLAAAQLHGVPIFGKNAPFQQHAKQIQNTQ